MTDEEKRDYERDHAYHYLGYPALSKWMASSRDFFLLRRYGNLTARSLLFLQHQIARIEMELESLDSESRSRNPGESHLDSFELDEFPKRQKLIDDLIPLLQAYCTPMTDNCNMWLI